MVNRIEYDFECEGLSVTWIIHLVALLCLLLVLLNRFQVASGYCTFPETPVGASVSEWWRFRRIQKKWIRSIWQGWTNSSSEAWNSFYPVRVAVQLVLKVFLVIKSYCFTALCMYSIVIHFRWCIQYLSSDDSSWSKRHRSKQKKRKCCRSMPHLVNYF